jgi:hypothetical protein
MGNLAHRDPLEFHLKNRLNVLTLPHKNLEIDIMTFETKYQDIILGTNSTLDRIIIKGYLGPISYPEGLQAFLNRYGILRKDFQAYSQKLATLLKENAKLLAELAGAPYEYLDSPTIQKDAKIKAILKQRGDHPGLVAVLTTLEVDNSFDLQKDSVTKKTVLVARRRKCLHIYFYAIDEQLGLYYFRLQTFFPFKVQIYFNGREQLARKLDQRQISYAKDDNCLTFISDLAQAQQLADELAISQLHTLFDHWAENYVIILPELTKHWRLSYHWSIRQLEYSKDLLFSSQAELETLYFQLIAQSAISALPENLLSFLGKKMAGKQTGRLNTSYQKSYLGYRLKHSSGAISIKMYNKAGSVLRIEITINNVSEIKIQRDVTKRDGSIVNQLAPLKKSIYSLEPVIFFCQGVITRYLDFLTNLLNTTEGIQELRRLTERITANGKNYKGFNPLHREDATIFETLVNGGSFIDGFKNKILRNCLAERLDVGHWTSSKVSRLLKRLRVFGLIHKLSKSHNYILTEKGRLLVSLSIKFRNMTVIPTVDSLLKQLALSAR